MKKIKVKANPKLNCRVPNFEAQDQGVLRFIGWKFDTSLQPRPGWKQVPDVVEVNFRKEYMDCLKSGELLPGDQETAKLVGVAFDNNNSVIFQG